MLNDENTSLIKHMRNNEEKNPTLSPLNQRLSYQWPASALSILTFSRLGTVIGLL
jgi:hypothetical protein